MLTLHLCLLKLDENDERKITTEIIKIEIIKLN